MTLAGLRIGVRNLDTAASCIRDGKIAARRQLKALVAEPASAFGATLIFEQIEG
jgi:hypothetical protein